VNSPAPFLWIEQIEPSMVSNAGAAVTPVMPASADDAAPVTPPVIPGRGSYRATVQTVDEVTRVTAEIAADRLRGMVSEIRRYLGCSQHLLRRYERRS